MIWKPLATSVKGHESMFCETLSLLYSHTHTFEMLLAMLSVVLIDEEINVLHKLAPKPRKNSPFPYRHIVYFIYTTTFSYHAYRLR